MAVESRARAHTNIALIKYWGKRNQDLFLPMTSSLSLTLDAFYTDTQVTFDSKLTKDSFILDGKIQEGPALDKVTRFVDLFRRDFKVDQAVHIESKNHVPTAAGLASSASAYAALAYAINDGLGLGLSNRDLSIYARQGSGSASRSLFGGFVEWKRGQGDDSASSYAQAIDPADWDIAMLVVLVNAGPKKLSSRQGMQQTIETSPFYQMWPQEVAKDLKEARQAISDQDIDCLGQVSEHNAMKMHATMLAAQPSFTYWKGDSLKAMDRVRDLRESGYSVYFTMDAGPNVKVICRESQLEDIRAAFLDIFDADNLIVARPGPSPYLLED